MADIAKVREVRERSGAGVVDCAKALDEAGGDAEQALIVLQKKGILKAQARGYREALEGIVHSYVHGEGRIGVLVEVNCQTDFVARTQDFRQFADDVAMQVAAMSPRWISSEEVPRDEVERQAEIFTEQLRRDGKPEKAWAKIVEGKLHKWYEETCLLDQESVVHPGKTVDRLRLELSARTGESVQVRRFARFEVGEGAARQARESYADEVARLSGSR